ncbi:MAG: class I SAM-dependent methyltransferase [Pseudomonadota bacterium]
MNITWTARNRFHIDGIKFRAFKLGMTERQSSIEEFVFQKPREMIERYARLVADEAPRRIFELGIWRGGSPVFFHALSQAARIVSVDISEERIQALDDYRKERGLENEIRPFYGVDQSDGASLQAILDREFEGAALDLVIDDASHFLTETRASFNTLFPALRPGGKYVIEDWSWAHGPLDMADDVVGFYPDKEPLTRLLFELVLACGSAPELIASVDIDHQMAVVTRGSAPIQASTFDIGRCCLARGRDMLAPPRNP